MGKDAILQATTEYCYVEASSMKSRPGIVKIHYMIANDYCILHCLQYSWAF